ncbi:MAG TPA: ABC transporter substrate-binding protein [Thermomicrobiales bacterium]|nr:ABC transporter substrate-binding protein [Thermomicrobiales bacterium]
MANTPIRMVSYNWDHLQPLATGDVRPEGIDLTLERGTSLARFVADPGVDATETSLSHYLIGLSRGERELVGLPVFLMRAFRHRCFLVRRDSPLGDFPDLVGKRVGTDGWANTGNTWSRAAMRERGVDPASVAWVVGPPEAAAPAPRAAGATDYPPYVSAAPEGQSLVGMLLAGELDALMIPFPPRGFFTTESPIVHLFRDYRAVERAYFQRVGYCPGLHVAALRRSVFERDPTLAPRLYAAFEESKRRWREDRRRLADTTPWVLLELEETAALLGEDWQPYGVEPNRPMLAAFCAEQLAQGLVTAPLNPDTAFADFQAVARG